MNSISSTMLQKTTEKVSNSVLNYYHLWTWLDNKITNKLSGRKTRTYNSVADFWHDIINQEIIDGDIVSFNEIFVSDWMPRQAGMGWIDPIMSFDMIQNDETKAIEKELKRLHKEEFMGKRKGCFSYSVSAINNPEKSTDRHFHQGVVRLPFGDNNENFAALSFTSADSWSVDLGIPLIVSKSVFNEFNRSRQKKNAPEASFTATVHFKHNPLLRSEFVSSLNSSINKDFLKRITQCTYLPDIFLKIISPIDIVLRTNNTHPPGDLWVYSQFVKPNIGKGRILFFRSTCNLNNNEEIETICESFKRGYGEKTVFGSSMLKNLDLDDVPFKDGYMDIFTEFDSRIRRFTSSVPIIKEPWTEEKNRNSMFELFRQLEKQWSNPID